MRDTVDVMLFAAGFGTRMRPLTDTRPKPLIEVGGRALLDHALDMATSAKISRIVVNAHYLAPRIISHLSGRNVAISLEESRILDTGGGLRAAMPALQGDVVATLNTDAVWTGPNPISTLLDAWDGDNMDALLLLVPLDRARGRTGPGDFSMDAENRVGRTGDLVYTGAHLIRADKVCDWPEDIFSLNVVWNDLIAAGRVSGVAHTGGWCDVGRPDGIATAEAMLEEAHHV